MNTGKQPVQRKQLSFFILTSANETFAILGSVTLNSIWQKDEHRPKHKREHRRNVSQTQDQDVSLRIQTDPKTIPK